MGSKCAIIVSQAFFQSAIIAAKNVAYHRYEDIGDTSGYATSFDTTLPRSHGSLMFCTNDMLLIALENGLKGISHVIIDDIEENNMQINFLLAVFKRLIAQYNALKLVLISDNTNVSKLSSYFNNCVVLDVDSTRSDETKMETIEKNSLIGEENQNSDTKTQLDRLFLHARLIRLGDCEEFFGEFIDKPSKDVIQQTEKRLIDLNALNMNGEITPLGVILAHLPVDLMIGKMLILGCIFSVGDAVCKLAAYDVLKKRKWSWPEDTSEIDETEAFAEAYQSDYLRFLYFFEKNRDSHKIGSEYFESW